MTKHYSRFTVAGKMQKEQRKTSTSVMMETTTTTEKVSEKKSPIASKRETKEEEVRCAHRGASINDVHKHFGFFDPLPPLSVNSIT